MSWTYLLACGCEQQLGASGWRKTVRCPSHPAPEAQVCADSRCEHPRAWHLHGAGACLECGCFGFAEHYEHTSEELTAFVTESALQRTTPEWQAVYRCGECGEALQLGHDCLAGRPPAGEQP